MQTAAAIRSTPIPSTGFEPRVQQDELRVLDRLGTVVMLRREQPLFREGDRADFYFKVVSGALRTCKLMADGRRHIGEFFLPGDFIGLQAKGEHILSAEAVNDAVVVRYSRRSVDALAFQEPRLGRRLFAIACESLSVAQQQMVLLGRKTAEERIASFILDLVERSGDGDHVTVPMTRTDIGDHLGLTMETVSRAFAQLKREGVIELKNSHSIVIRDRDALADLVDAG